MTEINTNIHTPESVKMQVSAVYVSQIGLYIQQHRHYSVASLQFTSLIVHLVITWPA